MKNFRLQYNENTEMRRTWGGGKLGIKSQHVRDARDRAVAAEQVKKAGL